MALKCERRYQETWRQCVERYAAPWGMVEDCLRIFDRHVREGLTEGRAAWLALREWDLLDFVRDEDERAS